MRLQEGPRWPQDGRRWPQEGSKGAQDGPMRAPRGPQLAPRGLQEGPRWPQEGSKRGPTGVPRGISEPTWLREPSRKPPGPSQTPPGSDFGTHFVPQTDPRRPKSLTKLCFSGGGERGYCATLLASCCAATRALRRNAADEARTKETLSCARQALDLESTMPDTRLQAARAHQALQSASKNKKRARSPPRDLKKWTRLQAARTTHPSRTSDDI